MFDILATLNLSSFTVFSDATFSFSKNLNVIIGVNGSGKSHVLRAAYAVLSVQAKGARDSGSSTPTKTYIQTALARKLIGVFKPDELGRLARRKQGQTRCVVSAAFKSPSNNVEFSFHTTSKTEVAIEKLPRVWSKQTPVFIPTRELMTIYPGFVSLYETTDLPFEETWRDTCLLLGAPLAKGPKEMAVKEALTPVEEAMGGSVTLDSGRFYLQTSSSRMEMHLVAEGLRKLAIVARLLANGSLMNNGYLFWDEPEANLNSRIVKNIAKTIMQLSQKGIQVFIATHSLFLLKELSILQESSEYKPLDIGYFGLSIVDGEAHIEHGATLDEINDIAVLDESIAQSDPYMELFQ